MTGILGLSQLYIRSAGALSSRKMQGFVRQAVAAATLPIEQTATDAVALQETPRFQG
jgi:hypothetical protein